MTGSARGGETVRRREATTSGTTEQDGSIEVRLPPQPSSVPQARRHVRNLLEGSGRHDLVEPAVLLVSEVVTNALLHAGTEIDLTGRVGRTGLRIEVGDGSPHLPSRRSYAPTAGTGRGLLMLEAMVDDWGVLRRRGGKTVWFELSTDVEDNDLGELLARRTSSVRRAGTGAQNVTVALHNMPLLLHAAWQEHVEALLREYLLASLDDEGDDSIQVHAEATDAIALLEEHVPRAGVGMVPDRLMGEATEPYVSAAVVEVPVPAASVPHFDTLDRAVQAALDLCEDGLVLTPPTQPEVQAFRRWLCRQVRRQAAGGAPEPWAVPEDGLRAPVELHGWEAGIVTGADHAMVAADQTSRIIAVSPAAAGILGYDDGAALVGRRIVSIIPERYRQAHVAGFTMYLLVGRRPLLDRPVVVPALRRDGSEISVELVVSDQGIGGGRSVLLADLRVVDA